MITIDSYAQIAQTLSPQVISHYNLYPSAEIDGSAALGHSSGEGITAMDELGRRILSRGFNYTWTGLSLEEIESGGKAAMLFALGLLFVYLTLAAQYVRFSLPFIVLLAVPLALLGAVSAKWLRGLQNYVYCQIGLVLLT